MSRPQSIGGPLLAEWTKLSSLRSTRAVALTGITLTVVFGVLAARAAVHAWPTMSPLDRAQFDAVQTSLDGAVWAEFAFAILGVLAVTSEYGTGTIRLTLVAVPARGRVLAAKLVVLGGSALLLGEMLAFASFFVGQAVLHERHLGHGLADPGVVRSVVAAGGYLVTLTLVGAALGAIVRHTAAGIAGVFAVLYLAYGAGRSLEAWSNVPDRWLLVNVGDALTRVTPRTDPRLPSLTGGLAELAGYLVVAVAIAAWRFSRDVA